MDKVNWTNKGTLNVRKTMENNEVLRVIEQTKRSKEKTENTTLAMPWRGGVMSSRTKTSSSGKEALGLVPALPLLACAPEALAAHGRKCAR